ncbi:hypothetical protein PIB30_074327, partial [Stylosanthes scabra]|nr:hypothetical protein [Stylosanthes scabra]
MPTNCSADWDFGGSCLHISRLGNRDALSSKEDDGGSEVVMLHTGAWHVGHARVGTKVQELLQHAPK